MKVTIKNRSNGVSGYLIPELGSRTNIRREFAPGESKQIDLEELKALIYIPGGEGLLTNYLQVTGDYALKELGLNVEPEYNMSEQDVTELLLGSGEDNFNAFLDCLDFAPFGVHDLIKKLAVSLPVTDTKKREAILDKLHFNVDQALIQMQEVKREEEKLNNNENSPQKEVKRRRRVVVNTPPVQK